MIYGVGTDLTDHQRIAAVWHRHGERFARRLLSAVEFAEFLSHPQPVAFLAKRWAAKEAIGKATGLGVRAPFLLPAMSIQRDHLGKPVVVFAPAAAQWLAERQIQRCHLSLSDEKQLSLAFVVLETDE
ncbi:holo-ACP synthase [Aquaspirillum serpens]|uniref:holo-ACP synthase n=1 Tax=Aquaspirillum serpens TaxID=190 RepID=UPI0003B7A909|nr:holo-ACP synthase [Aquaspirillum serpens]